jgi:hypothetical protein
MLRLFILILALTSPLAAKAELRTALVIGNAAYSYAPLANAANDANDIAAALTAAGFEVILKTNADLQAMDEAITAFGEKLKAKGGVGLFYFSGHGVQVAGENYILPVGEALRREADVKYKAINAGQVIEAMAGQQLNIVILDSCRNNPLAASGRSLTRGLARVEGGTGLFVSFATSPGSVALDGDGRNSPYTKHLVAAIKTPGLSLEEAFKRTLKGVYQETDGKQTPWISSSFFGDFAFLNDGSAAVAETPVSPVAQQPQQVAALAQPDRQLRALKAPNPSGVYRVKGINPNGSRYQGMVAVVPGPEGVRFTWWISNQVFSGAGHFAGRMLVVDWGESHPVIYTLKGEGGLEGEWADGSASETLDLFAEAASQALPSPAGRYQARGRSPDGSTYSGTVTIAERDGGFRVNWKVGNSAYQGVGELDGNVLTVDWGSSTPVVYARQVDGSLSGLWAAGRGEEVLVPAR